MKKYLITGLIILLPLALTFAIIFFVINLFTNPFVGFVESFIEHTSWYQHHKSLIHFLLKIVLLVLLFFFTVFLGFIARIFAFKTLISFYDYVMLRIPLVKSIYKAAQQVIKTVFGGSSSSFKQVVMVPYPSPASYAIGFVSTSPQVCEKTVGSPLVTVFVPTAPNPTSGFLMMYKNEDVVYVDMKIEDAFKYIISCGVINTEEEIDKTL